MSKSYELTLALLLVLTSFFYNFKIVISLEKEHKVNSARKEAEQVKGRHDSTRSS